METARGRSWRENLVNFLQNTLLLLERKVLGGGL